jgi:hypothetical protein
LLHGLAGGGCRGLDGGEVSTGSHGVGGPPIVDIFSELLAMQATDFASPSLGEGSSGCCSHGLSDCFAWCYGHVILLWMCPFCLLTVHSCYTLIKITPFSMYSHMLMSS